MRGLRLAAFVLGGLVALLALGLLAVYLLVDPNDFKPRIVKAVKEATGRELALPGKIKLAVFPAIALELGPASLGNPPGFPARPFVAVEHLDLHVKLLPLLRKELSVGRVEIDGLDLRLEKNPAGKGNWEDFGGKGAPPAAPTSSGGGSLGDVGGVLLKNSRVSYGDLVADQLNLEVGRIAAGTSTAIKTKVTVRSTPNAPPLGLSGSFEITPDPTQRQYHLVKLDLTATRSGTAGASPVTYKVSVPELDLDLAGETLSAPTFSAQVADARLSGAVRGSRIMTEPQLGGTFKLDPVSPRDLLQHLGVVIPRTRDPRALTKLLASGTYRYGGKAVQARDLDVRLDDSSLRGSVSIGNLDTKAMTFDLALDQMDFDRYRPPPAPPPAIKVREKPTPLPTEALKSIRASGKVSVGRATVVGVKLTEVAVTLAAKDGVIHIAPAKARLYGGTYAGDITLDGRGDIPLIKLEQSMTNIDAAQLLKDFAKSDRLSGRGNITSNLTARGAESDALLGSLAGHVAANLEQGALEGVDLWFEINRAVSVIQRQALPGGQSSGRTKFDAFKASADVADGVASTKDLSIVSQNLRVNGQGTANLLTEAIDYHVKATVLKDASAKTPKSGNVLADIPVTISGTLAKPRVSPDLEGLAKAQAQQQLDKHKDELKQKLEDQLKNLFK